MMIIKSIAALLSSSLVGRSLGFIRFQLLLFLFDKSTFTDTIIYTTTLIWTINNLFIMPTVNRSLIAELSNSADDYRMNIIYRNLKAIQKVSLKTSIVVVVALLLFSKYYGVYSYSFLEVIIIFIVLNIIGVNELFSLYNQFNAKYFLYAINPAIWNFVLILSVILLWILKITSLSFYLSFLLIAIIVSIIIQIKGSSIDLKVLRNSTLIEINELKLSQTKYWYNGLIIIYMCTTFFDLNIIQGISVVGIVTVYSIFLKLPELLSSLVNGSLQPVYFNRIVKDKSKKIVDLLSYLLLTLLLFAFLIITTYCFGDMLYPMLFNFEIGIYTNTVILAIVMMFFMTISLMIIRLSVEYEFDRILFFISALGIVVKIILLSLFNLSMDLIMLTNILIFLGISIIGYFMIMSKKNLRI